MNRGAGYRHGDVDDDAEDPQVARLRAVNQEADDVTNESLESTRNMRRLAEETRDVGAKTLQELDEQGDKLRKTNQELNEIDNDLAAAEKTLTQMEKCCGCCSCPCYSHKNYDKANSKEYKTAFASKELVTKQPGAEDGDGVGGGIGSARGGATGRGGKGNGEYIQRITNDGREDEMNENLGVVHDILGDLKNQAAAMGAEIDEQNDMIDQINSKTQSNIKRVDAADQRAQRLLRTA